MGKKHRCTQITNHEKNCMKRKKWKENIEVLTTTFPAASLNNRRFSRESKRLFSLVLKRCSARRGIGFGKCAFIRASLKPRYSSIFPSIEVFHAFSRVNSAAKDKQSEPTACRWMPRLVFGILCIDRFDRARLLAFTLQTRGKKVRSTVARLKTVYVMGEHLQVIFVPLIRTVFPRFKIALLNSFSLLSLFVFFSVLGYELKFISMHLWNDRQVIKLLYKMSLLGSNFFMSY